MPGGVPAIVTVGAWQSSAEDIENTFLPIALNNSTENQPCRNEGGSRLEMGVFAIFILAVKSLLSSADWWSA